MDLTTETVQSTSLSLQSIDNVHGSDGFPLGMLGVGDSITDDIFQENLEDTSGFFVDQAGDTFDTASASQSSDCWLGDSLDVITKYFSVTLCASLSKSFSSLAAT